TERALRIFSLEFDPRRMTLVVEGRLDREVPAWPLTEGRVLDVVTEREDRDAVLFDVDTAVLGPRVQVAPGAREGRTLSAQPVLRDFLRKTDRGRQLTESPELQRLGVSDRRCGLPRE